VLFDSIFLQHGLTALDMARAVQLTGSEAEIHLVVIEYLVVKEAIVAAEAEARQNRLCIML